MGLLPAEGRVDALACTHPSLRRYPVQEPFTPVSPKKLRARQLTPFVAGYIPRERSTSGSTHQKTANSASAHAPATKPMLRLDTAAKTMMVTPVSAAPSSASPA